MAIIKGSTKRGQQILRMAESNIGRELYDVYGSFSAEKARAMADCKRWYLEDNGYNFHICSANTFQFTVAWEYTDEETGEVMTRVETASNTYIVDGSRQKGELI